MKLNKLDLKTTNNFNINDIDIDITIPTNYNNKAYSIKSDEYTNIEVNVTKKEKLSSRIGIDFDSYYNVDIKIPKDTKIDEPIEFIYKFNNNDSLVDNLNIVYESGSKADIIIKSISEDNNNHFRYLKINTISNPYSNGSITIINLLNENSNHFLAIDNEVLDNSNIKHNIIDIGSNIKINNMYSNIIGYNSTNILNNMYIGSNSNILDMNYNFDIKAKNSKSIMKVEGALFDTSKKNFRGTIDFKEGSSKSVGEENENCILFSDTCISRSLPMLLCHEEDVIGTHGVSSGKVSKDKLFYLMSRGLDKKDASKLIVSANFSTIINDLPESIKEELNNIIDKRI